MTQSRHHAPYLYRNHSSRSGFFLIWTTHRTAHLHRLISFAAEEQRLRRACLSIGTARPRHANQKIVLFLFSSQLRPSNRHLRHICSAGYDLEKVLEVKTTDIKILYTDESVKFDIDQASVSWKCPNKNRRNGGRTEDEVDIRSGVASKGEIPAPADEPASLNSILYWMVNVHQQVEDAIEV
jgi:hypothetical protein